MYIKLVDEHKFESPILYIHSDEDEFVKEIKKWKTDLLVWVSKLEYDGMPLMRLEASVCMVDLLRHLTAYYIKTTPYSDGRIVGTFRLIDSQNLTSEVITEIKTYG